MPEKPIQREEFTELAGAVAALASAVRSLNRSLFGEKSNGPEDQYGQVGEHIAFLVTQVETRSAVFDQWGDRDNG